MSVNNCLILLNLLTYQLCIIRHSIKIILSFFSPSILIKSQLHFSFTSDLESYLLPFSYCSWGSQGKNAEVVCHSLLQWTMFCQTSPPWPVHLGCPYMAWLIVSLSQTRLWSMQSVWLTFCDCGFHSVSPLMDEDKRLVQASWWEGLAVGETGSGTDGQGQLSKSPVFCWWVELCSLPVVWPEDKLW